ncbi:FAD/NAD(P)-binding protein [uncultured Shewanella sp.]|uniref:FAD/NAD(P)-binding protein n=1 Tax=uncultured Shewanella sp. TaxID=173975 RepID=UPI0026164C56|nr:FAD/NAD(P)-binding protein [uncultured Shewanella sp.]
MPVFDIGIIGVGPAGLSILQRLLSRAKALPYKPNQKIRIALFEPNPPGTGVHSPTQSHFLSLHSTAIQADLFPQSEYFIHHGYQLKEDINSINGLNFFQWCREQKIKLNEFNQVVARNGQWVQGEACNAAREVAKTDYLPRYLVGEYLAYCYKILMNAAPENVECELFSFLVNDLELSGTSDYQGFIVVDEKKNIQLKSLILTLGYTGKRRLDEKKGSRSKNEIHIHYPLPSLEHIKENETVVIEGMDLCALDILSMLTLGRGGKIKLKSEPLTAQYVPSGLEPRIILFSRSGLLLRSRPEITKDLIGYQTLLFTPEHMRRLTHHRNHQLDFQRDIYPIICLEMRAIYILTKVNSVKAQYAKTFVELASLNDNLAQFTSYLVGLENKYGAFAIDEYLLTALPSSLSKKNYQDWCQDFLQQDIQMSIQGILNPVKAALEVWHYIVPQLRILVEFERLSPSSKMAFFTSWYSIIKRTLGGPEMIRNLLLLETMKAGVVQIKRGSLSRRLDISQPLHLMTLENEKYPIDYLVHAHLPNSGAQNTDSSVLRCLIQLGMIHTENLNYAGMDCLPINRQFRLISAKNKPNENIWVLGPGLEGITYLNHHLPSTAKTSMDFINADSIAKQALNYVMR